MQNMQVLRFTEYGQASVLGFEQRPQPVPKAGEVLIKVAAAAINPSDLKNIGGSFHASLPRVPGRDYAGTVVAGDAPVGQEVWGSGANFGIDRDGAHAQYIILPVEHLSVKPAALSMAQAAAIGVPYLAAWRSLVEGAQLRAGQTLLLVGAGGAVGHAAIQVAHWLGARVVGVDRRIQGPSAADVLIDSSQEDLLAKVAQVTQGRGVDAVFNCVGGATFEPALKALGFRGRYVALSSIGETRVSFDLVDFYHQEQRLVGVDTMKLNGAEIATIMDQLRGGFDKGHLRAPALNTWPFEQAVAAYQALEQGTGQKQILLMS